MANEEIASQVLDYWFAIEFLGQDSYDVCTEESKLVRALKTFKKADWKNIQPQELSTFSLNKFTFKKEGIKTLEKEKQNLRNMF